MEALPKSVVKLIKSLQLKKYRLQEQLFLVEGAKNIHELLESSFKIEFLAATEEFYSELDHKRNEISCYESKPAELSRIGSFKSNNAGIAVARMESNQKPPSDDFMLALDSIGDPGNLGTIIRTCDWFGIRNLLASENTVDFYNPKVINSTMGSFTRVKVYYCDLKEYLLGYKGHVWAADMEGESLHEADLVSPAVVIMGNESHGLSTELLDLTPKKLTIPSYGNAESLNVAVASSLVMYEWGKGRAGER